MGEGAVRRKDGLQLSSEKLPTDRQQGMGAGTETAALDLEGGRLKGRINETGEDTSAN